MQGKARERAGRPCSGAASKRDWIARCTACQILLKVKRALQERCDQTRLCAGNMFLTDRRLCNRNEYHSFTLWFRVLLLEITLQNLKLLGAVFLFYCAMSFMVRLISVHAQSISLAGEFPGPFLITHWHMTPSHAHAIYITWERSSNSSSLRSEDQLCKRSPSLETQVYCRKLSHASFSHAHRMQALMLQGTHYI